MNINQYVNQVVPNNAKWVFITRCVNHADVSVLSHSFDSVLSGDFILSFGDYIVLTFADRYAPV
jgi:hypothetical protein